MKKVIPLLILFLHPLVSNAGGSSTPKTDADFARLPVYCLARHKKKGDPVQRKMWKKKLGSGFLHLHHYCYALHYMNKSHNVSNKKANRDALGAALKEIGYVERRTSEQFYLRPEMAYKKGTIYERLGNHSAAMKEYLRGIALNPRVPALYSALSDLYKKAGDNKEAMNVLKQGLRYKPNSKSLNKRLIRLKN